MSTPVRLALALAACLAASPVLAEEAGPDCLTPAAALSNALAHGATAGRLDGVEAQALLDAINNTGEPTDYRADTVVVVLRPDRAVVAMFALASWTTCRCGSTPSQMRGGGPGARGCSGLRRVVVEDRCAAVGKADQHLSLAGHRTTEAETSHDDVEHPSRSRLEPG